MLDRSSQLWLPAQALASLAFFVYATHATQALALRALRAFEWKPGFTYVAYIFR